MDRVEVCGHKVLLKPFKDFKEYEENGRKENRSEGGIIIPEETVNQEDAAQIIGEVISIGPMAWKAYDGDDPNWKPWAKVGDIVFFAKYGGKFITLNKETYLIMDDVDIQGIFIRGEDNG